jgi:hypothetical protein
MMTPEEYSGRENKLEFDNKQLVEFAEYMQSEIHQFH